MSHGGGFGGKEGVYGRVGIPTVLILFGIIAAMVTMPLKWPRMFQRVLISSLLLLPYYTATNGNPIPVFIAAYWCACASEKR